MQLNLNVHFWVGFVVTIASAIAGGTVHLTNAIPADWIPIVTAWSSIIAMIGGGYLTVMSQQTTPPVLPPVEVAKATLAESTAAAKAVIAFLAIGLTLGLGWPGAAHAQGAPRATIRPVPLTGDAIKDIGNAVKGQQEDNAAAIENALAKPFQDLADFIGADSDSAIALSTVVPELQDGHGQQCWMATRQFGEVIKAHKVPLTLKAMTDLEALRLLTMAANNLCANVHCTQVFNDLANGIRTLSPVNAIPVPSLNSLCSKVPQVAVIKPIDVPAPAPVTPPTVP